MFRVLSIVLLAAFESSHATISSGGSSLVAEAMDDLTSIYEFVGNVIVDYDPVGSTSGRNGLSGDDYLFALGESTFPPDQLARVSQFQNSESVSPITAISHWDCGYFQPASGDGVVPVTGGRSWHLQRHHHRVQSQPACTGQSHSHAARRAH